MKSQALITISFVALLSAAASLVTTELALAGFGRMGGMGGSHMGGSQWAACRAWADGFGRMSGMGGASRMSGLSHAGGMSRMGNVSSARGLSMAKRGGGSGLRGNSVKHTKVADRDVGGKMKEKAGTATHDAKGRPIGGSSTTPKPATPRARTRTATARTTCSCRQGRQDAFDRHLGQGTDRRVDHLRRHQHDLDREWQRHPHRHPRPTATASPTTEVTNKPQASHIEVPTARAA